MPEAVDTEIIMEQRGGVTLLTLNRPQTANAINTPLSKRFVSALSEAAAEKAVCALVVTGSGSRAFCSGVDIKNPAALPLNAIAKERSRNLRACVAAMLDFPKPLVVAVNGVASGGGCMLALLADRVVAVDQAAFAMPEIDLGAPTYMGLALLTGLAGEALASDLVQTGRRMSAAEAHARGLVAAVVRSPDLLSTAQQSALELGSKPAQAFQLNKAWINQRRRDALQAAMELRDRIRG